MPTLPSDLEIARAARLEPIEAIAGRLGLWPEDFETYGRHVAKVHLSVLERLKDHHQGKYVLVSAITPTPLGEGKTITSVGLGQALQRLGHRSAIALRQPSMGPTFGIKGGAAGGGMSQVVPMERLNLHLTGDMHAVTSANNLLAAMVDNHIYHGNGLGIDPDRITWRRCLDLNDRSLREVTTPIGKPARGDENGSASASKSGSASTAESTGDRGSEPPAQPTRQAGFDITAASEVMAILALTTGLDDLRERLGRIVVGRDRSGREITAGNLGAAGAMTALLADAIQPNLLQTLEHTPVLIHAGPFANIAPGVSSVLADRIGLATADYLVTEAGFGSDIGGEKFFNLKCRASGLRPDAAVLVTTVRAMKAHTGRYRIVPGKPLPAELLAESPEDVREGAVNLRRHIDIVRRFGVEPIVAINHFSADHQSELDALLDFAAECGARAAICNHWAEGGAGAVDLAQQVVEACATSNDFRFLYALEWPLKQKIETIARELYRAGAVHYAPEAEARLAELEAHGHGQLPVCMAKTHLSLTDDPKVKGAPEGFTLTIREVRASIGAGFVVPLAGEINTMPGLPSVPAATRIDVDLASGEIVGLG